MKPFIDRSVLEEMIAIRRDLHQYPELSWQETRTTAQVGTVLERLGIPFQRIAGHTGIIAQIPGRSGVPAVALRADLDALPIHEETNLEFRSLQDGVMHACGHDGHTSMVLGAAALLVRETALPAPVRLIFQPAEEVGAGAQAMIEAGALDNVTLIFGGHLDRHYPSGTIAISEGTVNASADTFRITIMGQGGHAARPHESTDAVVVGSLLVMALQTIVSREINPAHPSVVTVGRFDAGTAANVIAARALLEGTIRAQDPDVRAHLKASLRRIGEAVGKLHGVALTVEIVEGTPAVINSPEAIPLARQAATEVIGKANVVPMMTANMGGEDFSYYLERVPGCYVRFGAQVAGRESYPAHSSKFDFDEQALGVGAAYFHALVGIAGRQVGNGFKVG